MRFSEHRQWSRACAGGLALAVLSIAPARAQAPNGGMTAHDVTRIRSVSSPVVSPDGNRVAYLLNVPRDPLTEDDGVAWRRLHVMDVATGTTREFVGGDLRLGSPGWMPDGTAVTYLARRDGDGGTSLYAIPVAGGESRKILEHESSISSYAISPDGRRVAFLARDAEPEYREAMRKRGFRQEVYEEDDPFTRVWVAELGRKGSARVLPLEGHASVIDWAPDGERLVVALAPTPLIDDRYMKRKLRIVDAGSGSVLTRIENPGKLGQVGFSPDGEHVAFVSAETINDPKEGRLMVARASDGSFQDLLPGLEGHIASFAWQDEETLAYLSDEGVETRIGTVRVDGSRDRTVIEKGGPILAGISAPVGSGIMAFVGQTPSHPGELYVSDGGGEPRRITDSNPWLADRRLASQEPVEWIAADGLRLEGILIRPLDGRDDAPTIVVVHGGPEAHQRNGWMTGYSTLGQVAAADGFAVFYPNYRASTGRGVEFSMLDHRDFAGKEFDDIVDGVDHLIEIGVTDGDRVGVTGGSYGGYATGWLTTRYSDRFAAGVMFVGISNTISKDGVSDIPEEMYLVHQRMYPWEDWQFFLERSPIFWADSSKTPLLIMHGKEDTRVPTDQSIEMYRHLKLRGQAPVRLILYPGEGHGNARAAARLDYNLRSLRWLEHYLKGPGGEPPAFDLRYEEDAVEATAELISER
ncbi:MAG: S9 family peptidase [marine benthic group bacterium]|nr:S9 family peptidase [Gemmatimonadota bacterium]